MVTIPSFHQFSRQDRVRFLAPYCPTAKQSVACNAVHSVEERMCRWLLMTQDRVGKDEFSLTHELMAAMLGVRRQSVSSVAGTLQKAGLIAYRHGVMRIVDREGLEVASCECYGVTETLYDRIMKSPPSG